ncbi:MAG TPA: Xaa-Pro peptidase family protein [Conexibacter sp.]
MAPATLTRTTAQTLRPGPLAAVSELATRLDAGALLASSTPAVRWLGVARPAGVHVLVSDGEAVLVAPDGAPLDAPAALDAGAPSVERYAPGELPAALSRSLARAALDAGEPLALERDALPLSAAAALGERPTIEAGAALTRARARKDAEELALIEAAAELVSVGHNALREAARAGRTELDLWGATRAAIEAAKGRPLHAVVDLMAGEQTALVGVPPSGASVAADAPILFDLAPRHDGWWADSCATFVAGGGAPTAALRRLHDAARAALEHGISRARPGIRARDLDALIRSRLDEAGFDCPHHIGHGVGAAPQEEPWIDRDAPLVLEEGMVVALEPGAYRDGLGARVEHLLLIEADGARPLTRHSLSLT